MAKILLILKVEVLNEEHDVKKTDQSSVTLFNTRIHSLNEKLTSKEIYLQKYHLLHIFRMVFLLELVNIRKISQPQGQ